MAELSKTQTKTLITNWIGLHWECEIHWMWPHSVTFNAIENRNCFIS